MLIGPGDYKTSSYKAPKGNSDVPAGVLITKPNVFVRGMNRNTVIVDGTKPGTSVCSSKKSAQNFGPKTKGGTVGLEGIEAWKADNVWIQNLTTCNFLGGTGDTGNEIWWNGGAGGGHVDGHSYVGSYLSATSTYFDKTERRDATYGVFTSDWSGGVLDNDYASNFNDSGFYIGGCNDQCNQILENSHAEDNAIGYSGTNSGGSMLIEHNMFDNNQDGFDTNAQNNSDWPSPQDGACPDGRQAADRGRADLLDPVRQHVREQRQPERAGAGLRGRWAGRHRRLVRGPQRHRDGQQVHQQRRLGRGLPALPGQRYGSGERDRGRHELPRRDPELQPVRHPDDQLSSTTTGATR